MSDSVIKIEDQYAINFFQKQPLVITSGEGIWVYTDSGDKYLDFTSGWAVTCLGHGHSAITNAIVEQSKKIIHNPNAGLTYSPPRAALLKKLVPLLPSNLDRVFFTNSGAEANDAAMKLSRKITGRNQVITTNGAFHGRTESAWSVTGKAVKATDSNLTPDVKFIAYNDLDAAAEVINNQVAALIVEPIQGEGGVNIPADAYLQGLSRLCKANGVMLIVDEIQTGFCRTGKFFATSGLNLEIDFLTMAKGLGGGFPIGAFAMHPRLAESINWGDHGGTYCGNPLACAVASSVIDVLLQDDLASHAAAMGHLGLGLLESKLGNNPRVKAVRGQGLLLAVQFETKHQAQQVIENCLDKKLFVTLTQGDMVRIFPALTINEEEFCYGLELFVGSVRQLE